MSVDFSNIVEIKGDRLSVHFTDFSERTYPLFLKVKALPEWRIEYFRGGETYKITAPARFAALLGVERPRPSYGDLGLWPSLLDDQRDITQMALDIRRFAYWGDCGLGKTLVGLEFARHVHHRTGGRVLIITMNEIVPQWIDEAAKFYGDTLSLTRLDSREDMKAFCDGDARWNDTPLAVTNYEKMNWRRGTGDGEVVNEMRNLAALIPDESQRLNTQGGRQKWALIKSAKGIEYKLALTATPAPNNLAEFASQASFLEKLVNDDEIMWTYFRRDEKTHRWEVRPHARQAFIEFLAGWSIYVRDPRRYGWRQDWAGVPPHELITHELPITGEQLDWLFKLTRDATGQLSFLDKADRNTIERSKLAQVARGFIYRHDRDGFRRAKRIESIKPKVVAELMRDELRAGRQTLCWTTFNAESRFIAEQLKLAGVRDVAMLHGDTKPKERLAILDAFRRGDVPGLISKDKLIGFGLNFQMCKAMIVSGFTDSYVAFYQLVRRAVRYGQTERVRVHVPLIPELEGDMWENLLGKQALHEATLAEFEEHFVKANRRLVA